MLLDSDYRWCACVMLTQFGLMALRRAERRALELLLDGNVPGSDIWTRVAVTIQQIQLEAEAA